MRAARRKETKYVARPHRGVFLTLVSASLRGVGHMTRCHIAVRIDEDLHVFRLWKEVGHAEENLGTLQKKIKVNVRVLFYI